MFIDNAYRILGLPVKAPRREIIKRIEDLHVFIALEQLPSYSTDLVWIGELSRDEEAVRQASLNLEDPKKRLEHILSWFWIINDFDLKALDALNRVDITTAVEIWGRRWQVLT
ncbi:MAG: hypothetical protein WBB67_02735 [bacterium]